MATRTASESPPTPHTPTPHSLSTHMVKAHVAFVDPHRKQFVSTVEHSNVPVLVTAGLASAGVKMPADLKTTKAQGYIATLSAPKEIKNPSAHGSDIAAAPFTEYSLSSITTYASPDDDKFWEEARDTIKALHKAIKFLFVPERWTRANSHRKRKNKYHDLTSAKTIHYDNKVWYPLSDLIALYDGLLADTKLNPNEWKLTLSGAFSSTTVDTYIAVDQTPLGSVTTMTTIDDKVIEGRKALQEHYFGPEPSKPPPPASSPPVQAAPQPASAETPTPVAAKATLKAASVNWSPKFNPFGTGANAYVHGSPACTTYLDEIFIVWQSQENGNPLYFGIYGTGGQSNPDGDGDGTILGPTAILDSKSNAAIGTAFTPTLVTLDDVVHAIFGDPASPGVMSHYIFNHDLTNPRWIFMDQNQIGPALKGSSPALGLYNGTMMVCAWVNAQSQIEYAYWRPNDMPPVPSTPTSPAPPPPDPPVEGGSWARTTRSVVYVNNVATQSCQSVALFNVNGSLVLAYWARVSIVSLPVQLVSPTDFENGSWSPVTPALKPAPTAQGLIATGNDEEYAVVATRSPGAQGIYASVYRKSSWDSPMGVNEASQDSVCAVIVNRVAYIFFTSTDGGPQYLLFGVYLDLTTIPYHPSSWMKDISSDRRLNALSVPGTHDTGTWGAPDFKKFFGICTQSMSLEEQLYFGCRAFDFRLELDTSSGNVEFCHGGFSVDLSFDDVLDTLYTFLDNQPGETLIITMKNDSDYPAQSDEDIFSAVSDYIWTPRTPDQASYWYGADYEHEIWFTDLPLLSQARGQIVVLRRFKPGVGFSWGVDFSQYPGTDAPSPSIGGRFTVKGALQSGDLNVQVQDNYAIGLGDGSSLRPLGRPIPDYDRKWGYVLNFLTSSAKDNNPNTNTLFVNYTSAACYPDLVGKGIPPPWGWSPEDLAAGVEMWFGLVSYEGINAKVLRSFDQGVNAHGLIHMDYPESSEELICSIIEANTFG